MDDEIVLLLQLVQRNGKIENLTKQGFQYSQVAEMITFVVESKFVEFSSQGMYLTVAGKDVLASYNKKLDRKYAETIISPQKEYKLDKQNCIYDIYLPSNINVLK